MSLRSSALIVAVALLAACSSSPTTLSPAPPNVPLGSQTWQIVAGGSTQAEAFQAADFYPNSMTIDAGDSVTWTNTAIEPHTVALVPQGGTIPPGPPQAKIGGNVFDGTSFLNSGFFNRGATYTVTFTKEGTYAVYCLIHQPEMTGTIVVQAAGAPLPSTQAAYTAAGLADFTIDIDAAAAAVLQFPYAIDGTDLAAGIQPGAPNGPPTQSSVVRYLHGKTLDGTTTVPLGTTITWHNISQFPHTVSFPIAGQPVPPGPPGRPASGGTTYDGSAFVNSGRFDGGGTFSLTFTKRGVYTYYCLFHDDEGMIGTVVVT
ncbi:MAG: hypothetical protein NVS1B2_10240 [Vulcanimicrobiaceae bacterium]